MDENDNVAKDLAEQTAKLSKLLASLTEQPNGDHGELIADHITNLHKYVCLESFEGEIIETATRELQRAHSNVTRWRSLGRFDKAFHSRDHAELLMAYQGTVQTALEELQVGPAMFLLCGAKLPL